jgi:hypothetical protein
MAVTQQNVKALIPPLLQSTVTAYTTLGKGILALDQLNKVSQLLEAVICSLKEEHGKYDDLLKVALIIPHWVAGIKVWCNLLGLGTE